MWTRRSRRWMKKRMKNEECPLFSLFYKKGKTGSPEVYQVLNKLFDLKFKIQNHVATSMLVLNRYRF